MKRNKTLKLVVLLLALTMFVSIFAACDKGTTTKVGAGANLNSITMIGVEEASAVTQMTAGEIDIFAGSMPGKYKTEIEEAGVNAVNLPGTFYELMTNNAVFEDGSFNPFSVREFRVGLSKLVDRDYIVSEVFDGSAMPRYFSISEVDVDYARYVEFARVAETYLQYDKEAGMEMIDQVMADAGITKNAAGKYEVNGKPMTFVFLIRNEDGVRQQMGDYVSNVLEEAGFAVDRQYKTSAECWGVIDGNTPQQGKWNIYTGGWGASGLVRDSGITWHDMNSPDSRMGMPEFALYQNSDEFNQLLENAAYNKYASMEERDEIFSKLFELEAYYSQHIWLADSLAYTIWDTDVSTSYNLAAGVDGSSLTAYTLKYTDQEGGDMVWANQAAPIQDPVNPVQGTNQTYDNQFLNFTRDYLFMDDPYTGLNYPKRATKAEVVIQTGLPVGKTYDWVDLSFEDEIVVPEDAMVDWDVESETWILAGSDEKRTAKSKVTYYLGDDLGDFTWHDGTPITLADIMMVQIMGFATAYEASPLYDEYIAPAFLSQLELFKGWRIVSEKPIVIEYYSDTYALDAETNVSNLILGWTYDSTGAQASWSAVAAGNKVIMSGLASYSSGGAADDDAIEWLNYLDGPSLEYLKDAYDECVSESYIPFEPTMGKYVTKKDAKKAYQNTLDFYEENGHFVVGCGPYYISHVMSVEGSITLTAYPGYNEDKDRWSFLSEPKIATVQIDGPTSVKSGEEAVFEVYIDDPAGEAYPIAEIATVKYLLYDSTGAIVEVAEAEATEDGLYTVTLSADAVTGLGKGACKIEVVVSPSVVAAPALVPAEFVVE